LKIYYSLVDYSIKFRSMALYLDRGVKGSFHLWKDECVFNVEWVIHVEEMGNYF